MPERGEERSAAREVEEVMRDLERLDSSVPGVGDSDGERCRRVEEMMPVSSAHRRKVNGIHHMQEGGGRQTAKK